jgi:5-keto-L-gluconate epimerase
MKWAYPFGGEDTAVPILGVQGDPAQVLPALADAGCSGIELFVRDPAHLDLVKLEKALATSGLTVPAIGTGPMVVEDRMSLTSTDPQVRAATIERLKQCVDLGQNFGAYVNIGKVRGHLGEDPDQARDLMRQGLHEVVEHAAAVGVVILIEPQSSPGLDNISTTAEGVAFVEEFGHANLRLMIDAYHAERADPWPSLAYVWARHLLRLVHIADTDRMPPGHGDYDLALHLATLTALGYDGFVTVEADPREDALATARGATAYLVSIRQ